MTALSVAVIQGGPSSEAEVSRSSAKSIARALGEVGHRVVRLELDAYLADSLRTGGYDVVFPIAHGAVGEDGSLQGLLEVLDMPYVGSGVLASALAMNKPTAKVLFERFDLPVAKGRSVERRFSAEQEAKRVLHELGDRLVVKPCSSGSAIGVTRFDQGASLDALVRAIDEAWNLDPIALVEQFKSGREITCGVLDVDAPPPRALPPTEILAPNDAFYTYEARYAPGRSQHRCPAPIGDELTRRVQEIACAAHVALGCRDLSRADFVVGDDEVTLLEVNTLPGFTDTSLFPEAAGVAGIPMPDLCRRLVESAHRRGPPRRNPARPLPVR